MAFGSIGIVISPKEIIIDITVKVTYKEDIGAEEKNNILGQIKQTIYNYIDNLSIAEGLNALSLQTEIVNVSNKISAFEVSLFNINGSKSYFNDISCKWNEQIQPGLIEAI